VKEQGLEPSNAVITMVPKTLMALDSSTATQTLRLLDRMDELDDIQEVFTNADFPDEALDSYDG
jgi:transcriptional/translational regulatory protein YebC/TACO1